jgi:predicted house-cleaning NTP pyrophosphatase (Maf/HAM1 superfamily)
MALFVASASARRRELLGLNTDAFVVDAAQCDESLPEKIPPPTLFMLSCAAKKRAPS